MQQGRPNVAKTVPRNPKRQHGERSNFIYFRSKNVHANIATRLNENILPVRHKRSVQPYPAAYELDRMLREGFLCLNPHQLLSGVQPGIS